MRETHWWVLVGVMQFCRKLSYTKPMTAGKLRILNDFAVKKVFGEKGGEAPPIAFLNAVLNRKPENQILSIEIIENRELPSDFLGVFPAPDPGV